MVTESAACRWAVGVSLTPIAAERLPVCLMLVWYHSPDRQKWGDSSPPCRPLISNAAVLYNMMVRRKILAMIVHKLIVTTRLWLHLQLICHAYMQVDEGCLRTRLLRYVCADSSKCETVKKSSLLLYLLHALLKTEPFLQLICVSLR